MRSSLPMHSRSSGAATATRAWLVRCNPDDRPNRARESSCHITPEHPGATPNGPYPRVTSVCLGLFGRFVSWGPTQRPRVPRRAPTPPPPHTKSRTHPPRGLTPARQPQRRSQREGHRFESRQLHTRSEAVSGPSCGACGRRNQQMVSDSYCSSGTASLDTTRTPWLVSQPALLSMSRSSSEFYGRRTKWSVCRGRRMEKSVTSRVATSRTPSRSATATTEVSATLAP